MSPKTAEPTGSAVFLRLPHDPPSFYPLFCENYFDFAEGWA